MAIIRSVSATVVASAPLTAIPDQSSKPICPGTTPLPGLMPTSPQVVAGQMIEPSVSVPTPTVARLAEIAVPVRIVDVAALAGVSAGTASKALNGTGQLRAETRERVRRAAEQLGFTPDSIGRGLSSGRSYTVGLITTDSFGRFSIPVMLGAENALGAGEMSVLLCDSRDDPLREQHYLRTLLARRVDVVDELAVEPVQTQGLPGHDGAAVDLGARGGRHAQHGQQQQPAMAHGWPPRLRRASRSAHPASAGSQATAPAESSMNTAMPK